VAVVKNNIKSAQNVSYDNEFQDVLAYPTSFWIIWLKSFVFDFSFLIQL